MTNPPGPVLLVRNEFELQDLVDRLGRDAALIERDFALMTIAAGLVSTYGDQLCFKGGFVLRHVHGHERFSADIDATRINPPKNKLDSADMAATIRGAGMRNLLSLDPGEPATDTGTSLDFDRVRYSGPLGSGVVAVEVSYRGTSSSRRSSSRSDRRTTSRSRSPSCSWTRSSPRSYARSPSGYDRPTFPIS